MMLLVAKVPLNNRARYENRASRSPKQPNLQHSRAFVESVYMIIPSEGAVCLKATSSFSRLYKQSADVSGQGAF